jgi:hypothetical protein
MLATVSCAIQRGDELLMKTGIYSHRLSKLRKKYEGSVYELQRRQAPVYVIAGGYIVPTYQMKSMLGVHTPYDTKFSVVRL